MNDDGPAFPDSSVKRLIEGGFPLQPAALFDNFNSIRAKMLLATSWNKYKNLKIDSGTLVSQTIKVNELSSTLILRKSGKYLVLVHVADQSAEIGARGTGKFYAKKGEVFGACYYFKKLQ